MDNYEWLDNYYNWKRIQEVYNPANEYDYCNNDLDIADKFLLESKYLGKSFFTIINCRCAKVVVKEVRDINSLIVYRVSPKDSEILYGRKEFTISPECLFSTIEDLIDYIFQEDLDII